MSRKSRRLELHQKLRNILGSDNVYFQPPATVLMRYPCIVYRRMTGKDDYADNLIYKNKLLYLVTVIDSDPDSETPKTLHQTIPYCRFDRFYTSDNLNHDVFNVYY